MGYQCAFQKTDLALGAGAVKEAGAEASFWRRCGMRLEPAL